MDHIHTSHDLLAHFDRPQLIDVERNDDARVPGVERSEPPARSNQRTTLWLLKWTAATAVLFAAAIILLEFVHLFAAEHTLTRAARAGAIEATLPRATYHSVSAAIERRLADYPGIRSQFQLTVLRNGQPTGSQLHAIEGDQISITLSAPSTSFLPNWLARLSFHSGPNMVIASAASNVPGRKLRPASSLAAGKK